MTCNVRVFSQNDPPEVGNPASSEVIFWFPGGGRVFLYCNGLWVEWRTSVPVKDVCIHG